MKKAMRVIVPLILALAVVSCAAWYFLVYDQAFTKELLLRGARYFESNGSYNISAFLYDVAYNQSSQDDKVAIELSEQYLSIGNYTKAEYTLAEAIAAKPTANLYIALSKLYVQQDKLLDAVNMLDNITNPAIREILDAKRPAAPVMTPEPGFYTQYVTVNVTCGSGTLYVSTDGEYPSVDKDFFEGPIELKKGETVLYALSVADNGLVSPLTVRGYTIGGVIEQVEFADKAMEAAIRAAIGADDNDVIFTDQLWDIKEFTVPAAARSFDDLLVLPYLQTLTVEKGAAGDLSVVESLQHLKAVHVYEKRISEEELTAIAVHTELQQLTLTGCSLSSISALEPLKKLEYLDLSANTLRNITVIGGMTGLKELYLQNNAITALDALSSLGKLEKLNVSFNSVTSLSPVFSGAKGLKELAAGNNQITSLSGISSLAKLEKLELPYNNISDIAQLANLQVMIELDLSHNALTELKGLSPLTKLRILNVSYNQITELPAFPKESELVTINAAHNLLIDLTPLSGLPWLNNVNVDYNPELESLEPLRKCYILVVVNAYGTKVTEVSFLTDMGVIVNFDPTLE